MTNVCVCVLGERELKVRTKELYFLTKILVWSAKYLIRTRKNAFTLSSSFCKLMWLIWHQCGESEVNIPSTQPNRSHNPSQNTNVQFEKHSLFCKRIQILLIRSWTSQINNILSTSKRTHLTFGMIVAKSSIIIPLPVRFFASLAYNKMITIIGWSGSCITIVRMAKFSSASHLNHHRIEGSQKFWILNIDFTLCHKIPLSPSWSSLSSKKKTSIKIKKSFNQSMKGKIGHNVLGF